MAADIILKGGTFYCGNGLPNDVDFVAVEGNRIVGLGKEEKMCEFLGPDTEIIEFSKDNLIMPGIHDNHIHLIQAGILMKYVQLYDEISVQACGEKIRDFADTIPDEKWVRAVGYRPHELGIDGFPTAEDLDRYVSDRPVLVFDDELHSVWLNTMAMEICGIDKETPVPEGGTVIRSEDGTPAGAFIDSAILMAHKALEFDNDTVKMLVNKYADFAVEMGITSVSDMAPYMEMDMSYQDVHLDMVEKGESRIRINSARNLFEDMDMYMSLRDDADNRGRGMYRVAFMKQFMDGTPINYTAWLLDDYEDNPGVKGKPTLDVNAMEKAVAKATEHGISVRLHACGDAATHAALDAYDAALKLYPDSGSRHMIEHLEVVSPEDIDRFGKLGIIGSVQPEHLAVWPYTSEEDDYRALLGKRLFCGWPYNSIRKGGAVIAGGSDCPVVDGNPYYGMFAGLTRYYADMKIVEGTNPEEKLPIDAVLDMYTIGSSYAEGREQELGTLETGKLADITVVDRNLIELARTEDPAMRDARSVLTMVDGRIVFRA